MKKLHLIILFILSSTGVWANTAFDEKLAQLGITQNECTNHSAQMAFSVGEPNCAYANISGITALPSSVSGDVKAYIDFYDNNGHFFHKKILLGLQGTEKFDKKSLAIDFVEDEWIGEETTYITFGDWVAQDSYHLKAFYEDGLRGTAEVAYRLYGQISNRNNGFPKAFPVALYINGDFYGMMAWQLKKHRDNYGLDKKTSSNVWLDGKLSNKNIWNGNIDWTAFEVRNPKDLFDMDGNEYDGDSPKELLDASSPFFTGSKKETRCAEAKAFIQALSLYDTTLVELANNGTSVADMRKSIETYYNVAELINYRIFSLVTNNYDGFSKNWLWYTLNGIKWTVAPYGCELTFGYNSETEGGYTLWPATQGSKKYDFHMANSENDGPLRWITRYYSEDLKARYIELRNSNIIDADNIVSLFSSWTNRIGEVNYAEEWSRWPQSPIQLGQTESMDRLREWITLRIQLLDAFIIEGAGIASVYQEDNTPTYYTILGQQTKEKKNGLLIIRNADGTTQKSFLTIDN